MIRCNYAATRVEGFVLVEDLGASVSVINDADAVVKRLAVVYPEGFAGVRIIACDTNGQWDELIHQGDKYAGLRLLGQWERGEIIGKAARGMVRRMAS